MQNTLTLTKQQRIWLSDIIRADIADWQRMSSRPVDEIGAMFAKLAQDRIITMQGVLDQLDAIAASEQKPSLTYQTVICGFLVVVSHE